MGFVSRLVFRWNDGEIARMSTRETTLGMLRLRLQPTLRGPFTTIEACAQRCLEEKGEYSMSGKRVESLRLTRSSLVPDGCVAVSRYGDQCSLYYTDRPNGSKLQLVLTTADNAGMYLGTCEDVQAACQYSPPAITVSESR